MAAMADGAGVLVMDDGFQNPSLHKDLSLLVIDGTAGFGNGRIIPAGPLRERPVDAISRASAAILMGEDTSGVGALLARHDLPVIRARIEPEGDTAWLRGRPVVAFAGIARPEKFFATLERLGASLVARIAFADHQRIPTDEFMRMVELASSANADAGDHDQGPCAAAGGGAADGQTVAGRGAVGGRGRARWSAASGNLDSRSVFPRAPAHPPLNHGQALLPFRTDRPVWTCLGRFGLDPFWCGCALACRSLRLARLRSDDRPNSGLVRGIPPGTRCSRSSAVAGSVTGAPAASRTSA